jgi:Mitochondrial carrier protein
MALASAVVGFATFFTTVAIADSIAPCTAVTALLAKNVLAATLAQLANSPFQLLKTGSVLSSSPSSAVYARITNNGTDLHRLWTGVYANLLGVALVAAQFTLFHVLVSAALQPGAPAVDPLQAGVLGATACLGASLVAYPGVALKTKVMANGDSAGNSDRSGQEPSGQCIMRRVACDMLRNGTVYAGIGPFLVRSVPPTGLLFAVQRAIELSS